MVGLSHFDSDILIRCVYFFFFLEAILPFPLGFALPETLSIRWGQSFDFEKSPFHRVFQLAKDCYSLS